MNNKPMAAYDLTKVMVLMEVLVADYQDEDDLVRALFRLCKDWGFSNFIYAPVHEIIRRLARHALEN